MTRDYNFRHHQRRRHIARKKRIIKEYGDYWHYKFEGELNKGKIHCSCPLCRRKTNDPMFGYTPTIQDRKRNEEMEEELLEL